MVRHKHMSVFGVGVINVHLSEFLVSCFGELAGISCWLVLNICGVCLSIIYHLLQGVAWGLSPRQIPA